MNAFDHTKRGTVIAATFFPSLTKSTGKLLEDDWATLRAKLTKHEEGGKEGELFSLSTFINNHRGTDDVISITGLVLDVEQSKAKISKKTGAVLRPAGPVPPPLNVTANRAEVLDIEAVLYTSHSHTTDAPRHRVAAPFDRPISVEELRQAGERDVYEAFARMLGIEACCDTGKWSASACFNMPRCDADKMAIAMHRAVTGKPLDAGRILAAAAEIGRKREEERQRIEAEIIARDGRKVRKTTQGGKLIAKLRDAMPPLSQVLVSHGYTYHKHGDRYCSPHSSSKIPGVKKLTGRDGVERIVSHHDSDDLNCMQPVWGAKAHDVVDVEIAERWGTSDANRTEGLHALAKEYNIESDVGDDWDNGENLDDFKEEESTADEDGAASTEEAEATDEELADLAVIAGKMPSIDAKAFYGPLALIAERATANSEATKIGVISHLIAAVACMAARPFFITIGDEPVGLNVYVLQVGISAKGRKGTSEQFAKRYAVPGFATRAEAIAEAWQQASEATRSANHKVLEAAAAVEKMRSRLERLAGLTPELVEASMDALPLLTEDLERETRYRDAYVEKTRKTDKPLSPATAKEYQRAIQQHNREIASLSEQIDELRLKHAELKGDLEDREQLLQALPAELVKLEEAHTLAVENVERQSAVSPTAWIDNFLVMRRKPNLMTGIASGAGIIDRIRDDVILNINGNEVEIEGVHDKRLLINLSECGSVLTAIASGRQVSEVWRMAWDCSPLDTGAKGDPKRCDKPFVCVSASITPKELNGLLFDPKDRAASADNGFSNRHLFLFVNREKLVSRPTPTEGVPELIDALFGNVLKVYETLQPADDWLGTEYEFTDDGAARWDDIYVEVDAMDGTGTNAAKLFGRLTTYCRKLAALLAMINGEPRVSAAAVDAALAWVRYSADTVNAVAATAVERERAKLLQKDIATVLKVLRKEGADSGVCVPRRDVQRLSKLSSKRIAEVVANLQAKSPAWVQIVHEEVEIGSGAKRSKASLLLTKWAPRA